MTSPSRLLLILAILSLAVLGCGFPTFTSSPPPPPPFDHSSLAVSAETVYYGTECADDQPTSFTVTATQLAGMSNPQKVTLQWAYVLPDGTVTQWENVPMTVPNTAGVYEATVEIDADAADALLNGQNGEIIHQVEAAYGRMGTYYAIHSVGGELIELEFCGLPFGGQPPVITTPPFRPATIRRTPPTVYYGDNCRADQPTSFTITAEQVEGVANPDEVRLEWFYVKPDGTSSPSQVVPMTVSETAGVFEVTVTLDAATVDSIMNGQDGEIRYEVEGVYDRFGDHSTYGASGPLLKLEFCGE